MAKISKQFANKPTEPGKNYSLYNDIRSEKIYKSNIIARDKYSRLYLSENLKEGNRRNIMPGQLIMFNYFEPKTKEELDYYDAMPCTIFFNVIKTQDGPRVLGFNIHYYPPRIRFLVLDKIFEIFKSYYTKQWNEPANRKNKDFDYHGLIEQLRKSKLDFGVRMYIPKLMDKIIPIPSKEWSRAVFTEGRFKKRTREMIMNYWKQYNIK